MFAPNIWSGPVFDNQQQKVNFKPYRAGRTLGEILQVTPDDGFYMNTYYDICPFSPSQKYLALTKILYQDRITRLGDLAEVVVVDLSEHTIRSVYKTKSWGYQLGANLHWGKSDRYLYTNDVLDGKFAVCVKLGQKYDIARYWGPVSWMHTRFGAEITKKFVLMVLRKEKGKFLLQILKELFKFNS